MSEFFIIRFEDNSYLRKEFESYDVAKTWATNYLENFPRPTKVAILRNVVELSSKMTVINTTETRHAS